MEIDFIFNQLELTVTIQLIVFILTKRITCAEYWASSVALDLLMKID